MTVSLHNLTVSYRRHPAIHHLAGRFVPHAATAIFGPNGAGKSTLLKAMVGMLKPDEGHVDLGNCQRRDIAYLPQQAEIDRSQPVSVQDLVATGLWHRTGLFGTVDQQGRASVQEALARVGLAEFVARPISALSSGQFQRVLFARILVQDARLILLDEPFSAVDARTTYDLLNLVQQWCAEGRTVIAILHDYEQVRAYFPYTLLLAREVVAWGPTAETLTDAYLKQAVETAQHWHERSPVCQMDGGA